MNEVFELSHLLPILLIITMAYIVRGIAGFGSGLIAIPLLAFFLPLSVAVPIVVLLDYLSSFSQGMKNREAVEWKEIVPLMPYTLIGIFTALFVFKYVDANLLPKIMGAFIIIFAIYTLLSVSVKSGYSRKWAAPAGGFGGLQPAWRILDDEHIFCGKAAVLQGQQVGFRCGLAVSVVFAGQAKVEIRCKSGPAVDNLEVLSP